MSTNLVRLIKNSGPNKLSFATRFDSFARHPSVWPFLIGSTWAAGLLTSLSVGLSDQTKKDSAFLHREIIMEEYKAKHGHYPH